MRLRHPRRRSCGPIERLESRRLLSLTHLYTFNDGLANDWIGSAHATRLNGASIVAGQLVLNNVGVTSGQTSTVQYLKLPANALPNSGSATVSAWYTTSNATLWSRVFDFGDQSGSNGNSYLYFSPRGGGDVSRGALRPAASAERAVTASRTDNNVQHLVSLVTDSVAGELRLYIDGALASSVPLTGAGINSINDVNGYIGRSLFNADPGFTGSINEVRIYDDAQPAGTIAADYVQGPSPLTHSPLVRQAEYLNRGLVAIRRTSTSAYIGWRLLGTDPTGVAFNLYRSANGAGAVKLNATALTTVTDYVDSTINFAQTNAYSVKAVVNGVEQAASETFTLTANPATQQHIDIALTAPAVTPLPDGSTYTYNANDGSVGDLDGDGDYEIILKWDPSNSKDSSQDGFTGPTYFDAYRLDGSLMWRIDLGRNIRAGAHYTQFLVYDFDGDGKAEMAMKTAPGTIDGVGNPVLLAGDNVTDDYRHATSGRINTGPEYITIFNGQTGAAAATVAFKPDRIATSQWGDTYGNRQDRILLSAAYLDGVRPSLVVGRGIFPNQSASPPVRNEITAWDFRSGQLTMRWWFKANRNVPGLADLNTAYIGQGTYDMVPADVDEDGKDEIVYGSMTIDDNGAPLYSTGLGHGDAMFVSDMDLSNPGIEVYMPMEDPGSNGHVTANVHDGGTGQVLFSTLTRAGDADPDVGRGNAMDIDPNHAGFEVWDTYNSSIYNVDGTAIYAKPSNMFVNFGLWWDADPLRELLDGTTISDWNYTVAGRSNFTIAAANQTSNNGTKKTPVLSGDLFGDWREEVIWRNTTNTQLQIWTTTISSTMRQFTLMHDTQYRQSVALQNVGYNQPPNPSFFLGANMATPPMPSIYVVKSPAGASGSVAGHVFHDTNADTFFNGADPSLSGITVYLDANSNGVLDGGELSTVTSANGAFVFATVPTGSYTVREVVPAGYAMEFAPQITVGAGFSFSAINVANARIVYTGSGSTDAYVLRRNGAGNFELLVNGALAYTIFSAAPSLTFNLNGGDDTLTLDAIAGGPVPKGGVTYDGGSGSDGLLVKGTVGNDTVTFSSTGATIAGAATVAGGGTLVTDTTLEKVTYQSQGGTDNVTINGGPIVSLPDLVLPVLTVNSGGSASLPAQAAGAGIGARNAASLTVNSGGTLSALTAVNHADRVLLIAASLSVGGLLDLGGNDLIARGANLTTITNAIKSGLNLANGGYWNGTSGITSSAAAANAGHLIGLGVLFNNFGGQRIYGNGTVYGPFDGQDATITDVLVKYTYYGDTDLDGRVNGGDYAKTDNGFNVGLGGWTNGDNNYDNVVNGADYSLIDNAFNSQGAVVLAMIADPTVAATAPTAVLAERPVRAVETSPPTAVNRTKSDAAPGNSPFSSLPLPHAATGSTIKRLYDDVGDLIQHLGG